MKNIISMRNISASDIEYLIDLAYKIETKKISIDLKNKIIALLFFEPSTRTAFSFDTAVKKLNGNTIIMSGTGASSIQKGETFSDTIKTVSQYADAIVIRSPLEGSSKYASEISPLPIINAGDGSNQHPTQALLDLYSIKKSQGKLDSIKIAFLGDLRFGRTVHSLVYGLAHFSPKYFFVSPEHLKIQKHIKEDLISKKIEFDEYNSINGILKEIDILYVTRIQKERFADLEEYEKVKDSYQIDKKLIEKDRLKENFKIMHPLPRVKEINTNIDDTPLAYYFEQAKNGVYMRQAIISSLLGEVS